MDMKIPEEAKIISEGKAFSPVLEISNYTKLVVMSGQTSQDSEGNLIEGDIKEQTRQTISNCENKLKMTGYSLEDVFKVDVYMQTFKDWNGMNEIYMEKFPGIKPARLAIQVDLDPGYLIEIQMWAGK